MGTIIIASALTVQDPRQRPMDQQEAADAAHAKWREETSDFLSYLLLWKGYHEHAEHLSTSKLRKWCESNFLSYVRMREWHDVHQQLKAMIGEMQAARMPARGRSNSPPTNAQRNARRRRRKTSPSHTSPQAEEKRG